MQLAKVFHLAPTHAGLNLGIEFHRMQAGPLWKGMYAVRGEARKKGWFDWSERKGEGDTDRYTPGPQIGPLLDHSRTLLGDRDAEFVRVLDLFADLDTQSAEVIATAYAVWNDFLLAGRTPTDDEIIHDFRTNWHPKKAQFTPTRIRNALTWLRHNRMVPRGTPPRTLPDTGS